MRLLITRFKWIGVVLGVLLILAGGTIIGCSIAKAAGAIKEDDVIPMVLSVVAAVLCFIIGAIYITVGLTTPLSTFFDPSFILGSISIAGGVVLLMQRAVVSDVIIYLIAISIIAIGAIYLIRGIIYAVSKYKVTTIVLAFVIATFAITAGILTICLKNNLFIVINIIIGTVVIAAGILQIWDTLRRGK